MGKIIFDRNIKFMIRLGFSDLMRNHRDISFDVLIPVQFHSEQDAIRCTSCFSARFLRTTDEVVIAIYDSETLIQTIRWDEWWKYTCQIRKKDSVGKCVIGRTCDEPCALTFDEILNGLTDEDEWSLECMCYWVVPAFENLELKQWNRT